MEKVVCDASVVVKWYIEEDFSEKALKIRDRHINGDIRIAAPELLPFEVLNALKYSGLFTAEELKDVAKSLSYYGIELYSLTRNYAEKTLEIALDRDITIYDASYVALAIVLNAKMYTADKKLINKLGRKYSNFVFHVANFV